MRRIAWLAGATRRMLMRLGLIKREPFTCRLCGYSVPLVGSREWQGVLAYDHWEAMHYERQESPPGDAQRQSERLSGESGTTTATQAPEATGDDRGNG
jgi:hypothetical protein